MTVIFHGVCFAGFPPDTPLVLYEEIKPDFVEKLNNYNDPLEKVLFISFTQANLLYYISDSDVFDYG